MVVGRTGHLRVLAQLRKKPESGLLFYRYYFSGRILLVQEYWDSFDKLLAYAAVAPANIFPLRLQSRPPTGGAVGIWHESYMVEADTSVCVYVNMPRFGLAAAAAHVKAEGSLAAAGNRMAV